MVRTQTEVVGFLGNLQKGLRKVRTELAKLGYDPAAMDGNLDRMIGELTDENARQEEMKRELKAQTAKLVALNRKYWGQGGAYLEAAIGAVGPGSDEAKNFQRIRSRIRLPADVAATAQEPLPEATQ